MWKEDLGCKTALEAVTEVALDDGAAQRLPECGPPSKPMAASGTVPPDILKEELGNADCCESSL